MIQEAIALLVANEELTGESAHEVAQEILSGTATACQIASFITALRIRGEKVEHIEAFAKVMRARAVHVRPPTGVDTILDTCGTGGDSAGTFNISTTAAVIASAAGVCVAKHGNRAVSSSCGSADVLAELGVDISASVETCEKCLEEIGLAFLFAPTYHTAMRHAVTPRREVRIRTIFNLVGPLSNPAGATNHLVGVYSRDLTETFAEVLGNLGVRHALVVHGDDGLDEVTTTSVTWVCEVKEGKLRSWSVSPNDFGIHPANPGDLVAEDVQTAARQVLGVLRGEEGPCADMALLNAGAALYAADHAVSILEGYRIARDAVATGKAYEKLEALIEMTSAGK